MSRKLKWIILAIVVSLSGLLPIWAALEITKWDIEVFFRALNDPKIMYQVIAGSLKNAFLIFMGNIGDMFGYYLIMIPLVVLLGKKLGNKSKGLMFLKLYGWNGAVVALVGAIGMGTIAMLPTSPQRAETFSLISTMTSVIGWGIIGNTIGSLGWVLTGISLFKTKEYKIFGILSVILGISYFIGGWIAGNILPIPSELNQAGIAVYLLGGLLWNIATVAIFYDKQEDTVSLRELAKA